MNRLRAHGLQRLTLALALAALLLRALIPTGFMPGWDRSAAEGGPRWLVVCETSPLHSLLAPRAYCHAGPARSDHAGHRLLEAHLACPFAAALGAALPNALPRPSLWFGAAAAPDHRLPPAIFTAPQHRLAAARAPPASS